MALDGAGIRWAHSLGMKRCRDMGTRPAALDAAPPGGTRAAERDERGMMSARRRTLARRLIDSVVDAVSDRAPWLSDYAYRAVAAPLQRVDPVGGARTAEARLDGIRDRVVGMAASGRIRGVEQRHIRRDLARTREDLERLAPRLSPVQARGLALRLAAYAEVLGALPGRPVTQRRAARARNAALLAAAAVCVWTGVLLLVASTTVAVAGGLSTGVVTALGVSTVRDRRAGRARMGGLAAALTEVDGTIRGPSGVDLQGLDRDRRALLGHARSSGRLDERGIEALRRIDAYLDDLLIRFVEGDLGTDASHLVRATVTRYLPDTLEPFLSLADPQAVVRGRPAVVEVADQLASIESGLAEAARRPARHHPETSLLLQGEFLRSKFGESSI